MCLGASIFSASELQMDRLYAAFREAGGNCVDTAHCYWFWLPEGKGGADRAIGKCIRRHGDSGLVRILSKGGHPSQLPNYPRSDGYLSPEVISSDIAESLNWLNGEPIDLYFLHRDDTRVPVGEILEALNHHILGGRLRAVGASNWSVARLREADAYVTKRQIHGFVASQPQFNLGHSNAPVPTTDPAQRYLTDADMAWHRSTGLPIICYSPTAGGYFATGGARAKVAYDNDVSRKRAEVAVRLARQLGVSEGQIALAYLRCQPFPVIPILGTTNLDHLLECLAAEQVLLKADHVDLLRKGDLSSSMHL